jgi:hypothetical protein
MGVWEAGDEGASSPEGCHVPASGNGMLADPGAEETIPSRNNQSLHSRHSERTATRVSIHGIQSKKLRLFRQNMRGTYLWEPQAFKFKDVMIDAVEVNFLIRSNDLPVLVGASGNWNGLCTARRLLAVSHGRTLKLFKLPSGGAK